MKNTKLTFQWIRNLTEVTQTLLRNTPRIWELARFQFSIMYRDANLDMLWAILSPLTQIGVYWFVFSIGLRYTGTMGEYPYLVWMVCGIVAWNLLSKAVLTGAGELRAQKGLISKVSIPPYLLLASKEMALFINSIPMTLIMFLLMWSNGWRPDIFAWNLLYYILCSVCFGMASSMLFSVLTLMANDFRRFLQAALRVIFFLTPIIWNPKGDMPQWFQIMRKVNPFDYIVWGYRNSLLYHMNFWENMQGLLAFWILTLAMYAIGCQWQSRVREGIADFL